MIQNTAMSEEMRQDAMDKVAYALEKYYIEKDIAAYIKKESDEIPAQPGRSKKSQI